jgi:LDH2 family malate/lactate/ureidoglycolate dehydrogenase
MIIGWKEIEAWSEALLAAAGLDEDAARDVAASLRYAEERGFASHGFIRCRTYVNRIRAGGISTNTRPEIVRDLGGLCVVDAKYSAGAFSAMRCTELAAQRAKVNGLALVLSHNANHFGAAGQYTERLNQDGLFAIAACNTDAVMCAPFGGKPVLGTNPLAVGVPMTGGPGPTLDMATTEASYGKILVAERNESPIPEGWAVDSDGLPTTSAKSALKGALLPAGGPKGFGLAFMIDALLGVGGAQSSPFVGALYGDPGEPQRLGHAFLAISLDRLGMTDAYDDSMSRLIGAVHASGTPTCPRPMVPGERELEFIAQSPNFDMPDVLLQDLTDLGRELGLNYSEYS